MSAYESYLNSYNQSSMLYKEDWPLDSQFSFNNMVSANFIEGD